MRTQIHTLAFLLSASSTAVLCSVILPRDVDVAGSVFEKRNNNPLNIDWSPAPSPEDGPPLSAHALRNKAYLPAEIGGIVGAYALSLVFVAVTLLLLAKRRREHLATGADFEYIIHEFDRQQPNTIQLQDSLVPYAVKSPSHLNFSYPQSPTHGKQPSYTVPIVTAQHGPGVDYSVDQRVVSADHEMAQAQLEQMYKYVMEQEEAKENGRSVEDLPPLSPISNTSRGGSDARHFKEKSASSMSSLLRKDKSKGLTLNLNGGNDSRNSMGTKEERTHSRTSSILSALKSPRKKKMQGINISSPIMTPKSATFPRPLESAEMSAIPPRHYIPAPPPPVPISLDSVVSSTPPMSPTQAQAPAQAEAQVEVQAEAQTETQTETQAPAKQATATGAPLTPETSPMSTASIDQRIGATIETKNLQHARKGSTATAATGEHTERDPDSAISAADSTMPLVGLPTSPKPGVSRFPSLPTSPRMSGFAQSNASQLSQASQASHGTPTPTSAVRTGGALPLRAYEPAVTSPSYASFATSSQTKQTVFERTMPQSPGAHTPWTGAPVPYSPYQPFSPVVPMTPSLVTKADRKRMRRMEPKTPTMEMVKSDEEIW